jgi:hypothetical protein
MELMPGAVALSRSMPFRRLEDRIRELSAKAVAVRDAELDQVLLDLKANLHEHTERLRKLAARKLGKAQVNSRCG